MSKKNGNAPTPIEKTSRERFAQLVQPRIDKAVHSLKVLGNCGNRSSYDYSEDEAQQIVDLVGEAYQEMIQRFQTPEAAKKKTLHFSDFARTAPSEDLTNVAG